MVPGLIRLPFFFNDPATTEIYTLSLHDALPISLPRIRSSPPPPSTRSRPVPPVSTSAPASPNSESSPLPRSEEHTSELQSQSNLVCRLLLEKKKNKEPIIL